MSIRRTKKKTPIHFPKKLNTISAGLHVCRRRRRGPISI